MMFAMGPTPDQQLIDTRPEDVSVEAVMGSWHAGYSDGRHARPFHLFPSDAEELQTFYADGFERGERDKLHMKRINERLPTRQASGASGYEPSAYVRLREALDGAQNVHGHLLENSQLITAGAISLVALALWARG